MTKLLPITAEWLRIGDVVELNGTCRAVTHWRGAGGDPLLPGPPSSVRVWFDNDDAVAVDKGQLFSLLVPGGSPADADSARFRSGRALGTVPAMARLDVNAGVLSIGVPGGHACIAKVADPADAPLLLARLGLALDGWRHHSNDTWLGVVTQSPA